MEYSPGSMNLRIRWPSGQEVGFAVEYETQPWLVGAWRASEPSCASCHKNARAVKQGNICVVYTFYTFYKKKPPLTCPENIC